MPHKRAILKWAVGCLVALVVVGCLCFLYFFPPYDWVKGPDLEARHLSRNHLLQIGLALHRYYQAHGGLPPAAVQSKDGRPLYSWRVLVLPYLEEQALYEQFDLDEPWDGPHNR